MNERIKKLAIYGCILIPVIGILCVLAYLGVRIPCPFYTVTGLLCPGCGNTRAVVALLHLDLFKALSYNPLFPVELFYILWVFIHSCRSYLKNGVFAYRPSSNVLDIILLVILLVWWVLRNFLQRGML